MSRPVDFSPFYADDALLDQLGAGMPVENVDDLAVLLAACWDDDVDGAPVPPPVPQHVVETVLTWRWCA